MKQPCYGWCILLLLVSLSGTDASSIRLKADTSILRTDIHGVTENTEKTAKTENTAGIWITLSETGLNYVKEVLLTQVLQSVTPLALPDVTQATNIPFVGQFSTYFSSVTLLEADVASSTISLGQNGITVQASDVASNLTLHWHYDYDSMWLPGPISDSGEADIQVVGMEAGLTLSLEEADGMLQLTILQCGTYIRTLAVQLNGETSWLYQWLLDTLEDRIRSTTEEQLNAQVQEGVTYLNSFLLGIPREVAVDDLSKLNFTIVMEPIISSSSLSIGIKGEFISQNVSDPSPILYPFLPPGLLCTGEMKMVTIALSESVFNDGAMIYYNADLLNCLAEKIPDDFLNTTKWKYLIPKLYHKYPNEKIELDFEVSSPPVISLTEDGFEGSAGARMIIEVVDEDAKVPVACISINASISGSAGLNSNNITGKIILEDLHLDLEWSNVGKVHIAPVKVLLRTIIKDILLPVMNLNLRRGFPLPIISGVELKDADIEYGDGYLLVCTDVHYKSPSNYSRPKSFLASFS